MQFEELRKEYLLAQAFSYITAGLFLISYTNAVQAKTFIFTVGIILCAISFIDLIVVTFFSKRIDIIESIDSNTKILIFPITLVAIFLSIPDTKNMGFVELRLYIFILWSLLAVFSIGVSSFKVVSKVIKANNDKKGFFYRLFVFLSVVSMAMGWFLMIYGIYDPKSTALLLSFNKQLYAPMTWFGIATLCVIPILILLPDDDDKNNNI